MRFIDLYAGLGGFHYALKDLGHQCVMASEIQKDLRNLYQINHDADLFLKLIGDIHKEIKTKDIPAFDILCAGFPCQPFSQAGLRKGLKDPTNGNHFIKLIEIINFHKPKYVFLENVPNLKGHNKGNTWRVIKESLVEEGYTVKEKIFSPDEFGVPQQRKRIYISAIHNDFLKNDIIYPKTKKNHKIKIDSYIEKGPKEDIALKKETINQLNHWEKFLKKIDSKALGDVPRFPVWSMEFGANYPYLKTATSTYSTEDLNYYKGKFGHQIKANQRDKLKDYLPKYSLSTNSDVFPNWKINYIKKNRDFYKIHKSWIDKWKSKILDWKLSHQKFEWNCGKNVDLTLKNKIIQFRPSGIRVKNMDRFPALVLSSTQVPIIYDKYKRGGEGFRYITKREAANLQSFPKIKFSILDNNNSAYRAFGNAVNVKVVKEIINTVVSNNEK